LFGFIDVGDICNVVSNRALKNAKHFFLPKSYYLQRSVCS